MKPEVLKSWSLEIDYSRAPCLGADQKARGLWERDWRSIARAWLKHAHSFDRCGGVHPFKWEWDLIHLQINLLSAYVFVIWTQKMTYQLLQCHLPRIAADRNTPRVQSEWESNRNSTLYPTGCRRSCRVYLSQKQMTSRAIPGSTASLQEMQPLYSHIFRWARLWLVQIGTLFQRWLSRPMLKKLFSKMI